MRYKFIMSLVLVGTLFFIFQTKFALALLSFNTYMEHRYTSDSILQTRSSQEGDYLSPEKKGGNAGVYL